MTKLGGGIKTNLDRGSGQKSSFVTQIFATQHSYRDMINFTLFQISFVYKYEPVYEKFNA